MNNKAGCIIHYDRHVVVIKSRAIGIIVQVVEITPTPDFW